jgi:prolyl 4-hydroxylase
VLVHTTGESIPANYRIAKSAFIGDDEHPFIAKISQRIGLVTGLAMDKAEALQVVNYGIGGQYEPHNDHAGVIC